MQQTLQRQKPNKRTIKNCRNNTMLFSLVLLLFFFFICSPPFAYIITWIWEFVKSDVAASRSDVIRFAHSDVLRPWRKVMWCVPLHARRAHHKAQPSSRTKCASRSACGTHRSKNKKAVQLTAFVFVLSWQNRCQKSIGINFSLPIFESTLRSFRFWFSNRKLFPILFWF